MTQKKKTYETKMSDLDAKIKALKQQKKELAKKHEVEGLKAKLAKQSEQIAQLTADNQALKAKLSDADMSTVAFDPTPKLEEQREKIEHQAQELKQLEQAREELIQQNQELLSVQHSITPRYRAALQLLVELGDQYGFNGKGHVNRIKKIKPDEK